MSQSTIDDSRTTSFHLRLAAFVGGGQFIDGYILGVIAVGLTLLPADFGLTPVWKGLIGASALIGLFFGGIVFGRLSDLIGRRGLYTLDLVVFIVGSIAQFFVENVWQLFVVRLIVGLAIGADYAVGPTYLAEFVPRKSRSRILGSLVGMFFIGYTLSIAVGVVGRGWGPDGWRWVLASSAVPALVVLLLRLGSPESPRWLVSKGRLDEAAQVCRRYIGDSVTVDDLLAEANTRPSYRKLLSGIWLRRVVFVGVFWSALAWPEFAIFTFLPTVLNTLGIKDGTGSTLVIRAMSLAGFAVGLLVVARIGRRSMLAWTLLALTGIFLVLGLSATPPGWLVVALFGSFAVVSGFVANLEFLYPAELFPTDIRASGVGLGSALSRVGAAAGTFLLPVLLSGPGLRFAMFTTAAVTLVGLLVTIMWAPETHTATLWEASTGKVDPTAASGRLAEPQASTAS
jgi:MFS transporter, putative metabolite transport protein